MKTKTFLSKLQNHPEAELHFQYAPGQWVRPDYHITEVKHLTIDAVDCGGRSDAWKETIVQLWEPTEAAPTTTPMLSRKALKIFDTVAQIKAFVEEAEIKFEYGNERFPTAQLRVDDVRMEDQKVFIHLSPSITDCKAKDVCVLPEEKIRSTANICAPGSGCC
ncbi:DUF6428 family protein [Croceiramulus getboli]|nr:DUF6428 family protein [Flavobacteriaceae bacterium YJPT1-3]